MEIFAAPKIYCYKDFLEPLDFLRWMTQNPREPKFYREKSKKQSPLR